MSSATAGVTAVLWPMSLNRCPTQAITLYSDSSTRQPEVDMLGRASAGAKMADSIFEHPRLAQIYDALEPERPDLELYVGLVSELGARSVLDVGCGTGTFACLLA